MNTDKPKRQRKIKPSTKWVVQKNGVDCRLASRAELGLGTEFLKTGLLIRDAARPTVFSTEESATRAIFRTGRHQTRLKGSMVDELPKLQPLLESGIFTTRTFVQ